MVVAAAAAVKQTPQVKPGDDSQRCALPPLRLPARTVSLQRHRRVARRRSTGEHARGSQRRLQSMLREGCKERLCAPAVVHQQQPRRMLVHAQH